METFSVVVTDLHLKKIIAKLIDRSAYFAVDPQPECKYEITVKSENESWLENLVSKLKTA
jgi:hypothetical protein